MKSAILLVLMVSGVALYFYRDANNSSQPLPTETQFLEGTFVTFAQLEVSKESLINVEGLPSEFKLTCVPDRVGDRLKSVKFLLTHGDRESNQLAHAHATGEVVLLATNEGTVRVKVLDWNDYSTAEATAASVTLQFDFMYPKKHVAVN